MIDFQFVHVDASSAKARKRNHHLARAHSARSHRRRRQDELIDITVYEPQERPAAAVKNVKNFKTKAVRVVEREVVVTPTNSRTPTPQPVLTPPVEIEEYVYTPHAGAAPTSQPQSAVSLEQVVDYFKITSVVFHGELDYDNGLQNFQTLCGVPISYHVLHYCAAIRQDQISGTSTFSVHPETLLHQAEALRLLNEAISCLEECNLDAVIFTVYALSSLNSEMSKSEVRLQFRGFPWQTDWLWDQSASFKSHLDCLEMLVGRRGGLDALQMPGLALSIARSDLAYAAFWLTSPRFAYFWSLDDETLAAYEEVQLSAPHTASHGLTSIAGILPFEVLDVMINIANTDRLLSNHLDVVSLNSRQLESARCIVHYQLLCLPAWDDTDGVYSEWADETVYECCRLTAILYSNAVIMNIPPHTGWHLSLCAQIRRHLEGCDMEELSGDAPGLLIWILCIASIAAYGLEQQDFFASALQCALDREGVETRQAAEDVLVGYLWSSEACGKGADLVWQELGSRLQI